MKKRANGTGWLERRGGNWLARWKCGGKYFSRTTGTGNRREAERLLDEWTRPFRLTREADRYDYFAAKAGGIRREVERIREAMPGLLVADAWDAYERAPERPDTTGADFLAQHETRWGRFAGWMARTHPETPELRRVTRDMAAEYLADLAASGICAGTYNRHLQLLRRIWGILALNPENKLPEKSPFDRMAKKTADARSRRSLSETELAEVCASVKGEMRVLFAVGLYTGLRLGDAATLRWDAVDMASQVVTVEPAKTAKRSGTVVRIPMHPELHAMLSETPQARRRGFVMPGTARDYQRCQCTVSLRVRRVFEKCGMETSQTIEGCRRARPLVGFHSLRHTFVSMSANAGTPLALVRRIVGHVSERMTERYYHESPDAARAAVNALPALLGAAGGTDAARRANAPSGRVAALCAAARGMTDAELAEAVERLGAMRSARDAEAQTVEAEAETERGADGGGVDTERQK